MIIHLKGTVFHKDERYVVVHVSGVGYKVFVTPDTLLLLNEGSDTNFWIHHVIREDASDLFGFLEKRGLDFFELLIGISGIGPRTAMGILSLVDIDTIKRAVASNDTELLTKVGGIGKKNAEKIILELKNKLDVIDMDHESHEDVDALEALESLGFSQNNARDALKKVGSTGNTSERIKLALKLLGK